MIKVKESGLDASRVDNGIKKPQDPDKPKNIDAINKLV